MPVATTILFLPEAVAISPARPNRNRPAFQSKERRERSHSTVELTPRERIMSETPVGMQGVVNLERGRARGEKPVSMALLPHDSDEGIQYDSE